MGIFNVHGGHSLYIRGASGYLDEVEENRKVKNRVIELLRLGGHTAYDCTDDEGKTQNQNLSSIVKKCNAHMVDVDISIHLNAGGGRGTEVWCYDSGNVELAGRIASRVSGALGIPDRGVKISKELYILRKTRAKAVLVECCFVDSASDSAAWNVDQCARAIVDSVAGGGASAGNQIDIRYQAFAKGRWWGDVINYGSGSEGYAGLYGYPMLALRANTVGQASRVGYLEYRAHQKNGNWYFWQRDREKNAKGQNFTGTMQGSLDGIQMRLINCPGHQVKYRVHLIGGDWLTWVTGYGEGSEGYAGIYGREMDGIQITVYTLQII